MNIKEHSEEAMLTQRRSFLCKIWLVLGGVALAELVWLVASFVGFRQQNPVEGGASIAPAGKVDDYARNSVTAFPRGAFYLVRLKDGGFMALSRRCTHLGCILSWREKEKRFICPCHSSIFDISGAAVGKPAPRALDHYRLWIENDAILVDTGRPIQRSASDKAHVVYQKRKGIHG